MSKNVTVPSYFPQNLQLLFIGLKLTGHIDWSWSWVLAPFWMTVAAAMVLALIAILRGNINAR